jgi:hypothetical protein
MVYKELCGFDVLHRIKRGLSVLICYIHVSACIAAISQTMQLATTVVPLEIRYVKTSR